MLQILSHATIAAYISKLQAAYYMVIFPADALQDPRGLSVVSDVAGGQSAGKLTSGTTKSRSTWEALTLKSMQVCTKVHLIASYVEYCLCCGFSQSLLTSSGQLSAYRWASLKGQGSGSTGMHVHCICTCRSIPGIMAL